MPILAAGTWQYDSETAENSVLSALEAGYRHIDTAYNYDNQEGVSKGIKRFLKQNSEFTKYDIFLTTKVPGCGSDGVSFENCGDDTHDIIAKNLELLNFSHIDLLLIHYPPMGKGISKGCGKENCEAIRHQWKALQHAFLNKKARAIGVSNFCQSCISCLLSWEEIYVAPVVNQIQYHVGMSSDPEGLISFSEAHGMVVQAYSPLGNNNNELIKGQDLSRIARTHEKTIPQVALKWIIQNNVTVVSKSKKAAHLKQNLDMFSWKLDASEMKFLNHKSKPFSTPSFTCDE